MFSILLTVLVILYAVAITRKGRKPPLAEGGWPIVGHTFGLLRSPEGIVDPQEAFLVLNSCLRKDVTYDYFKPWVGEGLVVASEAVWRKHRKLVNPTFHQSVLDSYLQEYNRHARALVQSLEDRVGKGRFNHAPYIDDILLQVVCSTAMGVVNDEEDIKLRKEYLKAKSKFLAGVIERTQKFWLHSDLIYGFTDHHKKQIDNVRTLHNLTNAVIKKRKTYLKNLNPNVGDKRFKPFLDLMLELMQTGAFTETEVQNEVDSFTFGGSETVSVTLAIALINIGWNPDVQAKICEELNEVFQGTDRDVLKQDLANLKYLEAVIKESARLFPAVPAIGRTMDKPLKIEKYSIPAGSRCIVLLWGVNRHPVWGGDAEQFRPERWLQPACPHYAFASFGLGRRKCIGINFAMMTMKSALAHVLRRYRVTCDVTLRQAMAVVARPLPDHYITIETR